MIQKYQIIKMARNTHFVKKNKQDLSGEDEFISLVQQLQTLKKTEVIVIREYIIVIREYS